MNRIILSGNLADDPKPFDFGGKHYAKIRIANNVGFGERKRTNWVDVTIWHESTATYILEYGRKGAYVVVQGEVSARAYTDKNGEVKATLEVSVNRSEDLELPRTSAPAEAPRPAAPAPQRQAPAPRPQAPSVPSPFGDDMPF
jgi:single-strand DNA-binding protein